MSTMENSNAGMMGKNRLGVALRYRLVNSLESLGIFVGVMIVIMAALIFGLMSFLDSDGSIEGSFLFFGFAASVTVFIMGICTVREDLRLFIQHGIGRKTTFSIEIITVVANALALAVAGVLVVTLGQLLAGSNGSLMVSDIYQLLYLNDQFGQVMALPDQLMSVLFFTVMYASAQLFGMFLSLGYYHLNRTWTIIVSIAVPVLLVFGLPFVQIELNYDALFASLNSPWLAIAFYAVAAVILAVVNWLLVRRVSIRAIK